MTIHPNSLKNLRPLTPERSRELAQRAKISRKLKSEERLLRIRQQNMQTARETKLSNRLQDPEIRSRITMDQISKCDREIKESKNPTVVMKWVRIKVELWKLLFGKSNKSKSSSKTSSQSSYIVAESQSEPVHIIESKE